MGNPTHKQLIQYLRTVVDLEVQYQTAQNAYTICQKKLSQLGIDRIPPKPVFQENKFIGYDNTHTSLVISGIGLGVTLLLALLFQSDFLLMVTLIGFVAAIIWVISSFNEDVNLEIRHKEREQQREKEYQKLMQNYNNIVQQNAIRVSKEREIIPSLKEDVHLLKQRRDNAEELLKKYYSLNIVKERYRKLPCVATFLEYLENELCYTLTGHEGCYVMFEEQLQRGIIINQLQDISNQLGQIRQNQAYFASALDDIRYSTNRLTEGINNVSDQLNIVAQNQRTQAYFAEQEAIDQRCLSNYILMRDWLHS